MSDLGIAIVGLAIAVGIAGVVVPVVPGALLVWAAIAVWAFVIGSTTALAVLAAATLLMGGAQVVKLLVPGRRLLDAGRPPPVDPRRHGAGRRRLLRDPGRRLLPRLSARRLPGGAAAAGPARVRLALDREALRAMGLSILIELSATVLAAGAWLAAVLI